MIKILFVAFLLITLKAQAENACVELLRGHQHVNAQGLTFVEPPPHLSQESTGLIPSAMGLSHEKAIPQEDIVLIAQREYRMRHKTALFDLREVEIRNLGPDEIAHILASDPKGKLTLAETQKAMTDSMAFLYEAYKNQGPERAGILNQIKEQDLAESPWVTHFLTTRWLQPLVHVQVLMALNPFQKLHAEEAWPEYAHLFGRQYERERLGELGRLFAMSPNKKPLERYRETFEIEGLSKADTDFYQFLTMKNAITWSLYGAGLDRLVQQTNLVVEKVLLSKGYPLHLGKRTEVKKEWVVDGKAKQVTEVVYSFDRSAMKEIHIFLTKILLKRWVLELETGAYHLGLPNYWFKYTSRDLPALEALGVIGDSPDKAVLVMPSEVLQGLRSNMDTAQLFVFSLDPEQLKLLKAKINSL